MSTINIAILNTTTDAVGMEWGLALEHVPAIDTAEAHAFLAEHAAGEGDTYALVVPEELWDGRRLSGLPYLEVDAPAEQAAELVAALVDDEPLPCGECGRRTPYDQPCCSVPFAG